MIFEQEKSKRDEKEVIMKNMYLKANKGMSLEEKTMIRKYKIFHEEKLRILEKLEEKIEELRSQGFLIKNLELEPLE